MEEKVNELRNYLPIYFESKENNEFIEYLSIAFVKNVEHERHQFAFIAFHMLYMSYIFKTNWLLKKLKENNIENLFNRFESLKIFNSIFDLSVIPEKEAVKFLKCLYFHDNQLGDFFRTVDIRNNCAHASGFVQYRAKEIEDIVAKELEYIEKIQVKTERLLKKIFKDFLNENWNPDKRTFGSSEDAIDAFIRMNLLSFKDIEYLIRFDTPELGKKSDNKKIIYMKVLYLVFLSAAQKFVDYDGSLFIKKLPILMHGFKEQSEVKIETLVNDEFSVLVQSLNDEDKKKFEKTTKVKLEQYQYA